MSTAVAVHVASVVVALAVGAIILLATKGTTAHRRSGWLYVAAILATALSSVWIQELRDGPSVFHLVSGLVGVIVVAGVFAVRSGAVWLHALLMSTSVLLTVVTGLAQFFDRLPLPHPALNAIVFLQLPMVAGFVVIWRMASSIRSG